MLIEFKEFYGSTKGTFRIGSTVELEDDFAKSLIDAGYAVPVKKQTAKKRTATKKVTKETRESK